MHKSVQILTILLTPRS